MKSIETIADNHFSAKHGRELSSRFRKLNDEMNELNEAFEIYQGATDPADRNKKAIHLIDELGDVQTVLSHITSIMGATHEELLINSIVKSKVREVIPGYMKGSKV